MKDRAFIVTMALVGALALLILADNVRQAGAPMHGPPTVDKSVVMEKVSRGELSFEEARYYSREDGEGEDVQ